MSADENPRAPSSLRDSPAPASGAAPPALDVSPETVRRCAIAIAFRELERAHRAIDRAERSITAMLDSPRRFTVADLLAQRSARSEALDDFGFWCDVIRFGAKEQNE